MSARLVDSDITKLVAVLGGVGNVNSPTITELNAAVAAGDITCATVAGYTLGMTGSDTIDGKSVCDKGNVTNFASANYAGELTFFLESEEDETAATSAYIRAAEFFTTRGIQFDLVRRIGKSHEEPFEVGDLVEVFGFVTDYPQYTSGADGNNYATFMQPLGQQSRFSDGKVAVVAATP